MHFSMQDAFFYRVVVFGLLCFGYALCYENVTHTIGRDGVTFTNAPPRDNVVELPRSPRDIPTIFYLYTRYSSREKLSKIGRRRTVKQSSIVNSKYDSSKRTVFICHGWWGSYKSQWVQTAKNLILVEEDVNIIAVDYKNAAATSWEQWSQSVADCFLVGRVMAYFMEELNRITGAPYHKMHIIGASYGAQVAGMAGKALKSRGVELDRITVTMPRENRSYKATCTITIETPMLGHPFNEELGRIMRGKKQRNYAAEEDYTRFKGTRLEAGDALFVDTYHSDGYAYDRDIYGWGVHWPHGDADFYPNGGVSMPGCDQTDWYYKTVCDHGKSVSYFLESISSTVCNFVSYPCPEAVDTDIGLDATCNDCGNGCAIMGYWADRFDSLPSGPYYVKTNANSPYCIP